MKKSAAGASDGTRRGGLLLAAKRAGVLVLGAATLGGCAKGVLQPKGPIGVADAKILLDAVGIMSAIVVPTIVALLVIGFWFRASNTRARYQPSFVYSGRLEIIVWSIPVLVIMFLGGLTWIGAHELDPYQPIASNSKDPPLQIQVISLDWKWLFIYPRQRIATVNELEIPAGTSVHFYLTSASVMNQFFVPQLGSMIATMNGMVTQLHLKADQPGVYLGESAQFSGDGFAGMMFNVRAVPQEQFAQWIGMARQSGPALDRDTYLKLAQQSQNVRSYTYRTVEPKLFDAVVSQKLPPGPGPHGGKAAAQVRPVGGR